MEFQCGVVSDVGTTRKVNQDSACIHIQDSIVGNVGLAVVCDGMGGLSHGEFASQSMIEKIEKWYDSEFKELLVQGVEVNQLREQLDELLVEHNKYLIEYGNDMGASMGTTVSLLLMLPGRYFGIHVGDSRLYHFVDGKIEERTTDHSVCQVLANTGEIDESEIRHHPDRNRLLRAIGMHDQTETLNSLKIIEKKGKNHVFLLCSDGFWEYIDEKHMEKTLKRAKTPEMWLAKMQKIVQKNGKNNNMDNYTAIAVFLD